MKKLLICLLVLIMCVAGLAACGGEETTAPGTTVAPSTTTAPTTTENTGLQDAKAYLEALYKEAGESTAVDYELIGALRVAGVPFTLEWSVGDVTGVTVTRKDDTTVLVDVIDRADADIPYTLTATITDADGNSIKVEFQRKVPKFKENTFADYAAAEKGDFLIVKGVVSGIIAKSKGNTANCLYVQDVDGGYYVYGLDKDPVTDLHVELGMTVRVTGTMDIYNGTLELKDASVEILNDGAKTDVVAKDLTDAFKAAADLKAKELVGIQGMYVTLKGVTIGELGDNGYHYFTLGNHKTYVRISSSTCPLTKEEQTAFTSAWESHLGWTADIAGVISVYDGKFYLTPCVPTDADFKSLPELDDAGKVAFEKGNVTFVDKIKEAGEITVPTAGTSYTGVTITWASNNACIVVDGGKLTVTLPTEDTIVKLTATLKSGDATDTVEFEVKVVAPATVIYKPELVAKPEANTAYKFAMSISGKIYYYTGKMTNDNKYLATSEDSADAADIYIEAVEGGYRFYILDGETKSYIDVALRENEPTKANIIMTATPAAVWTYDETNNIFTAKLGENSFFLGTYGTYTTISVSSTYYITDNNAGNIDVTQYPARFYTMVAEEAGATVPTVVNPPVADKAYKYAMAIGDKIYFFTGAIANQYYLGTSEDVADAVDVFIENVEGGVRFYFMNGETKTYIDVVLRDNDATKANIVLTTTPNAVFVYNAKYNNYVATLGANTFYIGTYGTYTTMSVSNVTYINDTNVDVSQYPSRFYELVPVEGGDTPDEPVELPDPTFNDAPVNKLPYSVIVKQNVLSKVLYLTGKVNGRALATTDDPALAVDVYVEASGKGYVFYIFDDLTKLYIELSFNTKGQACLSFSEKATVFTYDPFLAAWMTTVNDVDYFLGTTAMYGDVYACLASFLTTETTGVKQFPAVIVPFDGNAKIADGEAFKFGLYQAKLGKILYLDGKVSTKYLTTTENALKAVDVYAEEAQGGYKFYILSGTTKKYIEIYTYSDNKAAVQYGTEGDVFTYDATTRAWVTDYEGTPYYFGTYNNYNTVSASKASYINAENTMVEQFPAGIMAVNALDLVSDINRLVEEGVEYKFVMNQANAKKVLYLDGGVSGRYLTTTEDWNKAITLFAEEADGGYKFYYLDGTTKKYIDVYKNSSNKDSVQYGADGDVFTYDSVTKAWVTKFNGSDYYLGSYNSFETVSASKKSYINASNTGVSQFPINLTYGDLNVAPEEGVAYKFAMYQGNLKKLLYLNGKTGSKVYYLATSTKGSEGIDVFVEANGDGYSFYFMNGTTKTYINIAKSGSYVNAGFATSNPTVYTYDASRKAWVTDVGGTDYYLGTYNSFDTASASKLSFITPSNTGVSQFPVGLTFASPEAAEPSTPSTPSTPTDGTIFDFGANGSATHVDGSDLGTTKTYTVNGQTLKLTGMSKVYGPAYDAKGNSCIKVGASKQNGSFSFTVDADVKKVTIYVAKYKSNATSVTVNGTNYTINTASDNGEYTAIEIDTTTTKTITFATTSSHKRCMINSIVFSK